MLSYFIRLFVLGTVAAVLFGCAIGAGRARDIGQWDGVNNDPEVREWYRHLMRPDDPFKEMSCCGESDAYWADEVHVRDGKTYATITDDRPDEPLMRPHIDVGTEIEIPPEKLKFDRGNPTGHSVIFLGGGGYVHFVYCFVQNGGV
jgi:hypothetical protein